MLERQIMFKQLQELQRQKKLQELNDSRQQSVINQLSLTRNGIPTRDVSQMFMFGNANRLVHSPAQNLEGSSQCSHFHDPPHEPAGSFGPVYVQESEGLATLDPLEQKILFNMEDTERFGNMFDSNTDRDLPSVQSGSWSSLMQSAAAEAASGDGGVQEEWSGLSFQTTDISNENKCSNVVESVKNQTLGLYNNLPKPELENTSINGSSSFPGFHHFQNVKTELNSDAQFAFVNNASNKGRDFKKGFLPDTHRNFEANKAATLYNNNNSSSSSQYFGLRLAPPTQILHKNYFDPSQISQEQIYSNKSFQGLQSNHNQNQNQNHMTNLSPQATPSCYPAIVPEPSQETSQDGQESSSQVASSTRQPSASKIFSGKRCFSGNLDTFGYSLKQANASSVLNPMKNETLNYDNIIPQVTSANYKTQSMYDSRVRNNASQLVGVSNENLQRNNPNLDMANQSMIVLKSKKRKIPSFERLPWHKEVIEGCSRIHDMSTAELEWAYATNRLPEKLKEETKQLADSLRMVKPKRRLILTTNLMQVLFRPAPDATKQYDIVTYYAAKLALGDACSLASQFLSGKSINSKGSVDEDLLKVIGDFIDRSKRLEDELSRLENGGSSFLDIRVEFLDLEKFSVINRFAKFHSRGPLVAADTASPGGASVTPKLYPQRYVKASPMPRTVPEGKNCLLL